MKIHHVGYLVTSIENSCLQFQHLGYEIISPIVFDEERKVFIQFLKNKNNSGGKEFLVELVEPAEDCTLFPPRLKKLGTMPYHICYECDNAEEKVLELRDAGFILIRDFSPAPAIDNRRVAFMYSEGVGQIELLEEENLN